MSNDEISKAERSRIRELKEQKENIKDKETSQPEDEIFHVQAEDDFFTKEHKRIMQNDKIPEKEKKRLETLLIETEKNKKEIVKQLQKTPIVQFACDRTGIGRSTYYKWRSVDFIFGRAADRALEAGRFFINDLAESKLMNLINDSNLTAIIFWLKHNHPKFADINRSIDKYEVVTEKLSTEEENAGNQFLSRIISNKMIPKCTPEETYNMIEKELAEEERNYKSNKRFKSLLP